MDKALIRERFARAASTYNRQASVQRHVAEQMVALIDRYIPSEKQRRVWEVGCGTGMFTRLYLQQHHPQQMWLNDICPEVEPYLQPLLTEQVQFTAGDAEQILPPQQVGLIVSCSAIQWFDRPLRFIQRSGEYLQAGGYMAVSTFGPCNMYEPNLLSGVGLGYLSLPAWKQAVRQAGYTVVHAGEESVTLSFPSPIEVLKHIKQTGVAGISRHSWSKGMLNDFITRYTDRFSLPEGGVALSYHPLYLILKK